MNNETLTSFEGEIIGFSRVQPELSRHGMTGKIDANLIWASREIADDEILSVKLIGMYRSGGIRPHIPALAGFNGVDLYQLFLQRLMSFLMMVYMIVQMWSILINRIL